jgi:hypothetical protein
MQQNIISVTLAYKAQKINLIVSVGATLMDAVKDQRLYQEYSAQVTVQRFGVLAKKLRVTIFCSPMIALNSMSHFYTIQCYSAKARWILSATADNHREVI